MTKQEIINAIADIGESHNSYAETCSVKAIRSGKPEDAELARETVAFMDGKQDACDRVIQLIRIHWPQD